MLGVEATSTREARMELEQVWELMRWIDARAERALRDIKTGQENGLPVNGTTALVQIRVKVRDALSDSDQ